MKIAESAKSSLEQSDHLPAISWEDWLGMFAPWISQCCGGGEHGKDGGEAQRGLRRSSSPKPTHRHQYKMNAEWRPFSTAPPKSIWL
jgi:hypothetical protein